MTEKKNSVNCLHKLKKTKADGLEKTYKLARTFLRNEKRLQF